MVSRSFSRYVLSLLIGMGGVMVLLIPPVGALVPPPPPPGYVTGGLFMWYWQNLTSVGACPEGQAITGFSPLSGSYARPLCSDIFALKGIATAFGSGMTGSVNRLLKYTPDGVHAGDSRVFESGGLVGIGTDAPGAFLDVIGDILVNGILFGKGGGGIISNLVVGGGGTFLSNVSGGRNTVFGNSALRGNTTGNGNTVQGYGALSENVFGNNNVGVGREAGIGLTSGDNNIFLGYNTPPNISPVASNQLNIGNWIFGYNGNIGIGVLSPAYRLDVAGDVNFASGICIDGRCKDTWEDIGPWKNYGGSIAYTAGSVAIGDDFVSSPLYRVDVSGGYVNSLSGYCISGDCRTNWRDVGYWKETSTGLTYSGAAGLERDFSVGGNMRVSGSGFIEKTLSVSGNTNISGELNTDEMIHSENYVDGKLGLCINYNCVTSWTGAGLWSLVSPYTAFFSGNTLINGNSTTLGNGEIQGNLLVYNSISNSGNTYTSGSTFIENNLTVGGETNIGGNTYISGSTSIAGNIANSGNTYTSGSTFIENNLTVGGETNIGGNTYISGSVSTSGNISSSGYILAQSGYCLGGNCVNNWSEIVSDTLSGTTNYLAKYTPDGNHIGDSIVFESGGRVGVGTNTPQAKFEVSGSDALINNVTVGKGGGSLFWNTAVGENALLNNTTGTHNTALGRVALLSNTLGTINTAIGIQSLMSNTIGSGNTAVGVSSLFFNTVGSNNVALGWNALYENIYGNSNTALGNYAGRFLTGGNNNIFLGANTQPNISITGSNQLNLGNWIYGNNGDIGIGVSRPNARLHIGGKTVIGGQNVNFGSPVGLPFATGGNENVLWFGSYNNVVGTDYGLIYGEQISQTGPLVDLYRLNILSGDNAREGTNVDDEIFIGNVDYISGQRYGMTMKNGSLGIGTSTPSGRLDIRSGGIRVAKGLPQSVNQSQVGYTFEDDGDTGFFSVSGTSSSSSSLAFMLDGTEGIRIDRFRNVGIGTMTPSEKLDINGNMILDNGLPEGSRLIFRGGVGGNQEYRARVAGSGELGFFPIETGDPGAIGPVLTLTQGGQAFIGNYPLGYTTQDKLSVMGNVTATAYLYSSDARLKHDIRPLEHALDKVLALTGRTFTWNAGNKKDIGLIAQEVETVFPELVHTSSGMLGYKSIEYGNLVAPLIESVKELYTLFTGQKEELQRLRDENMKQEEKIHELESRLSEIEKRLR